MTMEEFLYGKSRSTYHNTIVHKVFAYLKRNGCTADFERRLVNQRITDAFGYSKRTKTWYICEIKVDGSDLYKAVAQIHDTVNRFQHSPLYQSKGGTIVPVIAIPKRLYDGSLKYSTEKWGSFCSLCRTTNIALWIVEQSTVRQIQGPKVKSTTKEKSVAKAKPVTKAKPVAKAKPATKRKRK